MQPGPSYQAPQSDFFYQPAAKVVYKKENVVQSSIIDKTNCIKASKNRSLFPNIYSSFVYIQAMLHPTTPLKWSDTLQVKCLICGSINHQTRVGLVNEDYPTSSHFLFRIVPYRHELAHSLYSQSRNLVYSLLNVCNIKRKKHRMNLYPENWPFPFRVRLHKQLPIIGWICAIHVIIF